MSQLSVSWPADGAHNWGQQVDTNLNAIVAQLNLHDATLTGLSGTNTGPEGPPGPLSLRFYTGTAWPDRPPGTETSPIINVSSPYPGAPAPPNSVEGDVWFP